MLPVGDRTPSSFTLPNDSLVEKIIKKPVRHYVYPLYCFLVHHWLEITFARNASFKVDKWLWGQRGNDFEVNRQKINRLCPLEGKSILIAGCGTGRDIPPWLRYRPESITGVDFFNYGKAWQCLKEHLKAKFPRTRVHLYQADLACLEGFGANSFDLIGSDAVFEHVKDFAAVLRECLRLLKPNGLLFATFGPLWYCWGGDHVSGYDGINGGYNHLLLEPDYYKNYLDQVGPYVHSEQDGRTFVANGLFSYLKPNEYLQLLKQNGFKPLYTSAILDPRAYKYLASNPKGKKKLEAMVSDPLDLVINGLIIIYRRVH